MKIALLTLWGCPNYGQNLQAYALQRFLRNAGHEVYLIRYPLAEYRDTSPWIYLKQFIKHVLPPFLLYIIYRLKNKKYNIKTLTKHPLEIRKNNIAPYYTIYRDQSYSIHMRRIGDFIDSQFIQSNKFFASFAELRIDPPEADVYIIGSDQVWNFWGQPLEIAKHETVNAYFLNFGRPEIKRIAYAASFGTRGINKKSAEIIKPLIQRFSYISVREETGLNLCKACGVDSAEWVPDPTLLLTSEHYRTLYNKTNISKSVESYCAVYMLRDNFDFLKKIYTWAEKKKLKVRLIMNNGLIQHLYQETFATIPEWLEILDNAEYVFTDSYHGTIFSLIFEKQFGIIPFVGCENDLRLNDLCKRFKLRPPFLYDDNFDSLLEKNRKNISFSILQEIYSKYDTNWINHILSN
jgi:hypothetical protein